jgi:hypothetical protein
MPPVPTPAGTRAAKPAAMFAIALSVFVLSQLVVPAIAAAPSATTGAATSVTTSSAKVAGTVNPNGEATTYAFQFGTTTAYGQQTNPQSAGSGSQGQAVSETLTGLRPGTTYHYRVIATNASATTVGGDGTFTTSGTMPPAAPPPDVATGGATSIGEHDASVAGTVNPRGAKTTYYFEFGLTAAYGLQSRPRSLSAGNTPRSVRATRAGLRAGQTYHYRLVGRNVNGLSVGQDRTFTTSRASGGRSLPTVTARAAPSRDRRRPFRFRVRGSVIRPVGISRSRACKGRVTVRFKAGRKNVRVRRVHLNRKCRFSTRVGVRVRSPRVLRVTVRFGGNSALKARSAPARKVRVG